jgi:hypothetical protein
MIAQVLDARTGRLSTLWTMLTQNARAALGDGVFGAAWEQGQALSLEQAIAEALGADIPA